MPIDFPNSPSVNDTYTVGNRTWVWSGSVWDSVGTTGPTGPTGPTGAASTVTGPTGPTGPKGPPSPPTFTLTNEISVTTGTVRYYIEETLTIASVRASLGTPPTGSSAIIDVNKNGTTIFTNQADRPTIAIGDNTDLAALGSTTVEAGDYLTVDIDQVGSTFGGADLTVSINLE